MAFWDNFSQKASETTARAMQKAKEMSDVAKLNTMISEEETKINNTYYQIGKLYVSMHLQEHEEEFAGMISSLVESEEKIQSYRQQIQDIKGVTRCTQCGAAVQSGAAFCSSCGASMPKVRVANTDDLVQCKNCGAMVKKDVRFCTSCGKPMDQFEIETTSDQDPMVEEQNNVCPGCGAKLKAGVLFCTECGRKL